MTFEASSLLHNPALPENPEVTPDELLLALRRLAGRWVGEHDVHTPYLVKLKAGGARIPLVWVFQAQGEGLSLAAALPDDQPLIGLKSVFLSRNGFDMSCMAYFLHDSYQEPVTTAYLADVMTALGDRPYVLGGNCSGAVTALHMALRAARRPRSLILLNYPTRPKPYDGPGLLIFGAKEWADFGAAAQASATFPGSRVALLPGGHGTYFKGSTLVELATLLSETTAPDADIAA